MPKLGMETIRRRQIIDAVVAIIESRGWNDLTFQQVSRVSGISTGVIVHYFGNKREVVQDAIAEAGNRLDRTLKEIRRANGRAEIQFSLLNALLSTPAQHDLPGPKFWVTVLANSAFDDAELRAEMARVLDRLAETAAETFRLGLSQGVFRLVRAPEQIAEDYTTLVLGLWSAEVAKGESAGRSLALARFGATELGTPNLQGLQLSGTKIA